MSALNSDRCNDNELIQLLRLSIAIHIVPIANDPDAENEVGLVIKNTTNIKIM